MLDGKGVYKGVQAEWTDWMSCFSPAVLAQLDYVLTDAMTFPGREWANGSNSGRRKAGEQVDMEQPRHFMDRFVDWHGEIMATEPFDILANASWLPDDLMAGYDESLDRAADPARSLTPPSSTASRSRSARATSSPAWRS